MDNGVRIGKNTNIQFNWLVIVLLLPITFAICIWKQYNGLYGQEPHDLFRYMQSVFGFLLGGSSPISQSSPVLYPLIGSIFSVFIPDLYSLQLVSMLAAGVCYISFCKLLNAIYPKGTQRQRYAFLVLFLSPFFFRSSMVGLPDMLSMAFLTWSLLELYKWQKYNSSQSMIISVCMAVFAIQTRYSTLLLLIPVFPMIWKAAKVRLSLFLITIFSILMAFTPTIFLKGQDSFYFLFHPWIENWSLLNLFKNSFTIGADVTQYTLPNILYALSVVLHPGFCIIGLVFIIFSLRTGILLPRLWLICLALFLIFIAGFPTQEIRLLMPAFPVVLLGLYPAYELLMFQFKTRNLRVLVYIFAIIIQIALSFKVIYPIYNYQQEELIIANALKKIPAATVNTFTIDGALRTYDVPHEIVNMWGTTFPLYNNNDLILFNQERFNSLYKDSDPVKNFTQLLHQKKLVRIAVYPNGWELFKARE
ncbi:MAG: glycosyltransferase family 39 protein [Bacteroidetes bacterium]|nr:glycosyltransferase family 39 protein [Bacteroidota bacterium]